ncbi:MAG: TrkH family potassium uptake protein [candidate division Zixibacteria bacterium]|nr:TrkH family potassium uptake protein [candidate division Zixibacteria bacterium]
MRKNAVGYAIGKLLQVMGVTLLAPLGIAVWDSRALGYADLLSAIDVSGFLTAFAVSILCGTALVLLFRSGRDRQGLKEGYAIVTLGWLGLALIGAIPFFIYFSQVRGGAGFDMMLLNFTDAYFEIMSGFTTTGATILTDIEVVPRSLLFLRALTHWLGGMGIITLAIVIFPAMGVSGYGMFRGEVPGPSKDRLSPRLSQTAQILWGVYGLLTAGQMILLMVAGMDWFDAVCHSFATMATGGFSTRNASIAGYESDLIEWIVTLFMFFAGINFVLHFKALRGDLQSLIKNREFLFYSGVILTAILVITTVLYVNGPAPEELAAQHYRAGDPTAEEFHAHYVQQSDQLDQLYDCFRIASFQALAIITTTGFVTADFDLWPDFLRLMLVFLMFFGGCAGSTGGGMKIIRIMIVFKAAILELRKLVQPRLVATVKLDGISVEEEKVINIVSFFILFSGLFVITAGLISMFVPDLTTAVSCSIATIGNIGPGLAGIGATENYAWIPTPGKWVLVVSMLLGRLEIFTVLIVLRVATWRK